MATVYVRVYAELSERLPPARRGARFAVEFQPPLTIAALLHDLALPEEEIDLLLVNGESVPLEQELSDGSMVSVYPVFESFDITSLLRVRQSPLRQPRFVLDVHLGKLASRLRLLGFDTLYRNDYTDTELLEIACQEGRVLLSKDRRLLQNERLTRGYHVREKDAHLQTEEVVRRFDLAGMIRPFSRCLCCNTLLEQAAKETVSDRLPPRVKEAYDEFWRCPTCDRVYWRGSHFEKMTGFVQRLLTNASGQGT